MKSEMTEVTELELTTVEGGDFWTSAACGAGLVYSTLGILAATGATTATFGLAAPLSAAALTWAIVGTTVACGKAIYG